mmetsp:Transcript_66333/g.175684  ORF Transcript_66333/g.175684 Transcript_66333/m.175684 type:complete len:207 (+) Transcript_66333:925-1545(+)
MNKHSSSNRTVTLEQTHYAFRECGLQSLDDHATRERRHLGGFHHHCVSCDERRNRKQQNLVSGKIPRRTDADDAHGLPHHRRPAAVQHHWGICLYHEVDELILPNRTINLLLGLREHLAHFFHNHSGEFISLLCECRQRCFQQGTSLLEGLGGPGNLGRPRSSNRGFHDGWRRDGYQCNHGPSGWIRVHNFSIFDFNALHHRDRTG